MPVLLQVHPVLSSSDVAASVAFFAELGFVLRFQDDATSPRYAAVVRDSVELHIQWHDDSRADRNKDRPVYRFLVDNVEALYADFIARAPKRLATPTESPWHRPALTPWGTREFHIHDPDRNGLQFYEPA